MGDLKLNQLQTFIQVIEQGTFSAAADKLQLTQPAVSQQIRQLESSVGVRLVERVGKRATATAAGIELLEHARRIDAATHMAMEGMAEHAKGILGRVRIGTGATACTYLLPPVLRELKRKNPSLDITVKTGNTSDVLKLIESNFLDIGLVTLPASGRMFHITPLLNDEFVAITTKNDYPLPRSITPKTLAAVPLVLYEAGGNTRRVVDEWFAKADISPAPIMDLGSVEAIKQLVGAGLGCAVLPGLSVRNDSTATQLCIRRLKPRLIRKLALVIRKDKPLRKGLKITIDALKQLS